MTVQEIVLGALLILGSAAEICAVAAGSASVSERRRRRKSIDLRRSVSERRDRNA